MNPRISPHHLGQDIKTEHVHQLNSCLGNEAGRVVRRDSRVGPAKVVQDAPLVGIVDRRVRDDQLLGVVVAAARGFRNGEADERR